MTVPAGFPKTGEDELLLRWWRSQGERGLLILEVQLGLSGPGDWPDRRRHKRLDGLYLADAAADQVVSWNEVGADRLSELIARRPATVLESKAELNTDVIGQAVAGIDMLSRSYPHHGRLDAVATVWGPVTDPVLSWVAGRRGITVYSASPP